MLKLMTSLDDTWSALRAGTPASALEGPRLEFKAEGDSIKGTLESLADAVVCLANADGGTIVVGVADSPGKGGSFLGVGPGLTEQVVTRGVFDRTQPALSVPVEAHHDSGARLLVITVPRGATLYANAKGLATRRVGPECRPFPPDQQRQALASRGLYDWSAETSGRSIRDADPREIDRLRPLLVAARHEDTARLADDRMLAAMRLAGDGELTRAGLLLIGRSEAIAAAIPTYGYAYQYRPSPGSESTARLRETRPLLAAVERLLETVDTRRAVHSINVAGGVQLQVHDYSSTVVRELVVNALVHRDYEFQGAVEVEHSPDRLAVGNPGGLVFGVTPDNILTHPSTPRNRLLLEVVTDLQVAERTGQGVDRVYRELLRAGKAPPAYEDDGSRVTVTVPGGTGTDSFVRFVETDLDTALSSDVEVLLALSRLRDRKSLSADQLAPAIQRSTADAQGTLERMAHAGLIEPSRRTSRRRLPIYSLSSTVLASLGRAVAYHRRTADGLDQKIVDHVTEYGFITNQTLRRLFDLGVYPARDLLRDLQNRDVLLKLDDKTAGPGIRYGPGPGFPRSPARGRRTRPETKEHD